MIKQKLKIILYFFQIILIFPSFAATVPDGKIIVRIEDGATMRCINSTTDRITMHMRRLIVRKDVGIFTEDKTAAIVVNTMISGEEGGLTPKKVSFPRMYNVNVIPYSKDYISLPVEEKLFSRFPLSNSGNSYDTVEIEFTILAKKDKAPFGVALSVLSDISKDLPVPMNPFSDGFKYFSDYANKVVDQSLTTENNIGTQSKEGKITLSFSSTDTCIGDQEHTGTLAVISGVNEKEANGFVDIKKAYCWKAEFRPVFTLKFAPIAGNSNCTTITNETYKPVSNPYVAFYLNAEPKTLTSSKNAQVKTLGLPSTNMVSTKIKPHEIKQSILAAYDTHNVPDNSHSIFIKTVQNIADKASRVLEDTELFFTKGSKAAMSDKPNSIKWQTTVVDSSAIDIAESLKRCSTHGIDLGKCF